MEFPKPVLGKMTVYSKSGCVNCVKVKTLLKTKSVLFNVVDCDEFILEQKQEFLDFIEQLIGKKYNYFPMVFDGYAFVGGYNETNSYVDKLLEFDSAF